MIIIIAAILAVVLVVGIILGSVLLVRGANSLAEYRGVTVTRGMVSYLVSITKVTYLSSLVSQGVDAKDTPEFWNSEKSAGVSYISDFSREFLDYLRGVLISAYYFELESGIDSDAANLINEECREVLMYHADGDVKKFNELTADMGFTYADFCATIKLLYKAERAAYALYGNGTSLSVAMYDEYFSEYSKVKTIYILKNERFVLDADGNYVTENGKYQLIGLTEEEKVIRENDIADAKAAIEAISVGGNGQFSKETFDILNNKYNNDPKNKENGYYFAAGTEYTSWYNREFFSEVANTTEERRIFSDVTSVAGDMDVGEFKVIENEDMAIILYRAPQDAYDYAADKYKDFFGDFYQCAAIYHYNNLVKGESSKVVIKDKYYSEINLIDIKKNTTFKIW